MTDVIWPTPARWDRDQLIAILQQELSKKVIGAFLFGSFARKEADSDSDVDLLIIAPTHLPWPERASAFADLRHLIGAMDLLVYTPEEWQNLLLYPTPFFEEIQKEWVPIVEPKISTDLPATR
jgi:predicted nucleotidyltransferase